MGNYYFVVSSFPAISLGAKPEMSYEEIRQMVALNLSASDWRQVVLFQQLIDIQNMRALWLNFPLDSRGNYKENELDESLLVKSRFPAFVLDYLERYETLEDRLRYFPFLLAQFYRSSVLESKGFLRKYFQFEREMRLCLIALRQKEFKKDLVRELQFEDPDDPFVAQLLAQKDEKETILPHEYDDLKKTFLENIGEPRKLYRAIIQIRLSRIEDLIVDNPFSVDHVLGYLARLLMIENWVRFDEKRGREIVEQYCH